jgi:lipid A 3-O-deacylase
MAVCAVLAAAAGATGAAAQDFGISEIRLGLADHDVYTGSLPILPEAWRFDGIEDVAFDVLFHSPDIDAFRWIGSPRPNLGATISMTGRESMAHAGLTWQLPVFDTPVYLEGTLGAAIHNGALTGATLPARNLGCRVNFYEAFGIGAHLTENVTATIYYEHMSNAGLCVANQGLSHLAFKLGWKF